MSVWKNACGYATEELARLRGVNFIPTHKPLLCRGFLTLIRWKSFEKSSSSACSFVWSFVMMCLVLKISLWIWEQSFFFGVTRWRYHKLFFKKSGSIIYDEGENVTSLRVLFVLHAQDRQRGCFSVTVILTSTSVCFSSLLFSWLLPYWTQSCNTSHWKSRCYTWNPTICCVDSMLWTLPVSPSICTSQQRECLLQVLLAISLSVSLPCVCLPFFFPNAVSSSTRQRRIGNYCD